MAVLYAAEGQFWGADPRPAGCRRRPQPGQPAPPAEAGRSPLECSHEESSWCSWRPLEWRARADGGGGVLLAPHRAPSVRTGASTEGWPAQGLSRGRSAPQVQCHARAGAGHNGKPSFPMNSVPAVFNESIEHVAPRRSITLSIARL